MLGLIPRTTKYPYHKQYSMGNSDNLSLTWFATPCQGWLRKWVGENLQSGRHAEGELPIHHFPLL